MKFNVCKVLLVFAFLFFVQTFIYSQEKHPAGQIKGKVLDYETKQPLPGVNIFIPDSGKGTASDINGMYQLNNLENGHYSVAFSFIGYEKIIKTDIIISPGRIFYLNVELIPVAITTQGIEVSSGFFDKVESQPLSSIAFSSEEIRRAPGAAGDVSRIIFGLPSLAKINDTKNSLIVRGGSAVENKFYIDNIEIPNINHFPVQGSTEGPIGIINVDFIENVNFFSGGFSSIFPNSMSSIMELKFREGNRNNMYAQLEMSMQGFGGVIEGPLSNGKGSYMLSVRRSYLDLLLGLMNEKVGMPTYSDIQGKVVYDLSKNQKLSFIDVFSIDHQVTKQEDARDNKNNVYPDYNYYTNTSGINLQSLWGNTGYSNISVSHSYSKTKCTFSQTKDGKLLLNNHSVEQEFSLRNINHFMVKSNFKIELGIDAKLVNTNYNQFYNEYQDLLGNKTDAMTIDKNINSYILGGFTNMLWNPIANLSINPGVRFDHYSYNSASNFSPRISLVYNINDQTSLTGAFGIYYQNIPWVIAAQKDDFKKLKNPKATHYILGINHLLTESTKLTLEFYNKEYSDFPMDPTQPDFFIFDQAVLENIFMNHQSLVSEGKANSKGIELTIQKKLAKEFYGLISGSLSKVKYQDLNGQWHDRIYENRFNFAVEGGYKPNERWEFSLRWIYAGGAPYTPFNEEASVKADQGVLDYTKINASRLPDFHSLNVRVDRRFHYQSSTLIVYLSIWNAYGRKNISSYSWNEIDNKIAEEKMWGTLPVFGIEYKF
jgi:hypothetical protein